MGSISGNSPRMYATRALSKKPCTATLFRCAFVSRSP